MTARYAWVVVRSVLDHTVLSMHITRGSAAKSCATFRMPLPQPGLPAQVLSVDELLLYRKGLAAHEVSTALAGRPIGTHSVRTVMGKQKDGAQFGLGWTSEVGAR